MTTVEGTQDPMIITLAGDCIIQQKTSGNRHPRFLELVELLRSSDASLTNLEGAIHDGKDWPAFIAGQGGFGSQYYAVPPWVVEELQWYGFDLVFTANNHASDFAEAGILTTLKYLDGGGLLHSGSGHNLTEATAPTYIGTPHGRVAVINAADNGIRSRGEIPFPLPRGCLAADEGPWFPDRPGINMLRYEPIYHVDQQTMDALRHASAEIGWEHDKELRRNGGGLINPSVGVSALDKREDTDTLFHFNGTKYLLDNDEFKLETVPYPEDLERNYKWIREARRNADVVVVGMHQQGSAWNQDDAPDHSMIFARGAIDAGADVFVGHGGENRMCGAEVYNGGIIIYGVPGFITGQKRTSVPLEQLARFGLPVDTTPGEFVQRVLKARASDSVPARFGAMNPSKGHAVFSVEFGPDHRVSRVLIYPTERTPDSGTGAASFLAERDGPISQSVLELAAKRSESYGTKVDVVDGIGVIQVR